MIRDKVMKRADGMCEAMIQLRRTWTRCGRRGAEDHHLLTRARGGAVLDAVGETYRHLALCPKHHRMVDDMGFESGLLIQGYAYRDGEAVVYQGPDEYLSRTYPPRVLQEAVRQPVRVSVVHDEVRGPLADADARGEM